ncbi:MAG: hypothetical protein Q8P60_11605 [Pseudorhodobacter sp.]|nr:hypothetical protein [Pseudorhodobacter sp.]
MDGSGWMFAFGVIVALVNSMNEDRKIDRRTTCGLIALRAVYMSMIAVCLFGLLLVLSVEMVGGFMLVGVGYGAWISLEKL